MTNPTPRAVADARGVVGPTPGSDSSAQLVAPRHSDYRAFTICQEPAPWLATVESQTGAWLRGKRWDVDLRADGSYTQPRRHRELTVRHHKAGRDHAFRFVLEEDNAGGHWTTQVTAVEHVRGGGWVSVQVQNEQGSFVPAPNIARFLIASLHLHDGGWELSDQPHVIGVDRLSEVLDVVRDPQRRGPVFVAGTDEQLPFEAFRGRVTTWAREVDGLGHVVVLDPHATRALHQQVGEEWAVPAWTLRTFLPDADLTRAGNARRHRILGTRRLAEDSDRYLNRLLGLIARSTVADHPTPRQLAGWQRTFNRLENAAVVVALATPSPVEAAAPTASAPTAPAPVPVPPVQTEVSYRSELSRIRDVLGIPDLSDTTLRQLVARATAPRTDPKAREAADRRLAAQQRQIDEISQELDDIKAQLLDEQVDHLETREDLEQQADRALAFSRRLTAAGLYDLAYAPVSEADTTTYPTNFEDLLDRGCSLDGITISADPGTVRGLDAVDTTGNVLHLAWDALCVLADYAKAVGCGDATKGVHHYLQHTPSGYRTLPLRKHAWTETGRTMQDHGDERRLPVPVESHPDGYVTMTAHFKLGRVGMVSPRLYYLDDTAARGQICIGYIGPHMTNTRTS